MRLAVRLAFLIVALTLTVALALNGRAALAADPVICAPHEDGCLWPTLYQSPRLEPIAAAGDRIVARVTGPQGVPSHLRLFASQTGGSLRALADIPLANARVLLQGDFLYALEPPQTLHVYSLANPRRPVLVYQLRVPVDAILDAALIPGALYVAIDAEPDRLEVYSLADPMRPALATEIAGVTYRRLEAAGGRLFAATARGLALLDIDDPLAPQVVSARDWFTNSTLVNHDLHVQGGWVYLMANVPATGDFRCRLLTFASNGQQQDGGPCPFPAGKTAFFGHYAYVNPNLSPAQFLDYRRYVLHDAGHPVHVGYETLRFAAPLQSQGMYFAATMDQRLTRLKQGHDGALAIDTQTWGGDAPGTPVLFAGETLLLDAGAAAGGGRVLRFVSLADFTAPQVVGEVRSPWIGVSNLLARAGLLASLHGNRVTFFDVRNARDPHQLGQIVPPGGERLHTFAWANGSWLYAVSDNNTVLTIDISTPLTPVIASLIDLPGATQVMAAVPGTLYLFGASELQLLSLVAPGSPEYVKTIPGVGAPRAVSGHGAALYLLRDDGVDILDVRIPTSPLLTAQRLLADGPDEEAIVGMLPVAGDRLFVVARVRRSAAHGYLADVGYRVKVFALEDPLAPYLISTIESLPDPDVATDGRFVVLGDLTTYAVGPARWQGVMLPASGAATFAPSAGITYQVGEGTFYGETAAVCLEEVATPEETIVPGAPIAYGDLHRLRAYTCATGATILPSLPIGVEIAYPAGAVPHDWPHAALMFDTGLGWEAVAGATNDSISQLTGTILPLRPWAVVGPPLPPVLLPAAFR